jgi:MoxR-like ATPase
MNAQGKQTVADVKEGLARVGYLADEPAALVSYLAQELGKPVLVEGPAGVGKTELAKEISRASGRRLIRLQCYEGLDEAKALYEWNYRKQLLWIQSSAVEHAGGDADPAAAGGGAAAPQQASAGLGEIFGEEFLLTRPLLEAIAATEPVVLLIDEIDKTDQEFEAMLLEVLSDFQIRAGGDRGAHAPDRRPDLQQLAGAHRGAQAPLSVPLARLPRDRARDGDRPSACAGDR